jgi:hypothetical protein
MVMDEWDANRSPTHGHLKDFGGFVMDFNEYRAMRYEQEYEKLQAEGNETP